MTAGLDDTRVRMLRNPMAGDTLVLLDGSSVELLSVHPGGLDVLANAADVSQAGHWDRDQWELAVLGAVSIHERSPAPVRVAYLSMARTLTTDTIDRWHQALIGWYPSRAFVAPWVFDQFCGGAAPAMRARAVLERCDELWFAGEHRVKQMEAELDLAQQRQIPVFDFLGTAVPPPYAPRLLIPLFLTRRKVVPG